MYLWLAMVDLWERIPEKRDLTDPRQRHVLAIVQALNEVYFWADEYHGVLFSLAMELCPTIEEAAALTGMSEAHVRGVVQKLREVGLLEAPRPSP